MCIHSVVGLGQHGLWHSWAPQSLLLPGGRSGHFLPGWCSWPGPWHQLLFSFRISLGGLWSSSSLYSLPLSLEASISPGAGRKRPASALFSTKHPYQGLLPREHWTTSDTGFKSRESCICIFRCTGGSCGPIRTFMFNTLTLLGNGTLLASPVVHGVTGPKQQ